jgi:hypothetical protein
MLSSGYTPRRLRTPPTDDARPDRAGTEHSPRHSEPTTRDSPGAQPAAPQHSARRSAVPARRGGPEPGTQHSPQHSGPGTRDTPGPRPPPTQHSGLSTQHYPQHSALGTRHLLAAAGAAQSRWPDPRADPVAA